MQCHIKLCNDSIAEIEQQHNEEAEMAEDNHEQEVSVIEGAVGKRVAQHARIIDMRAAVYFLCDSEEPERSKLWNMTTDEAICIREEVQALHVQIEECEKKFRECQEKATAPVNERIRLYRVVIENINDYAGTCGIQMEPPE